MTRVPVVDDNDENLYLLCTLLEGHGHAVAGPGGERQPANAVNESVTYAP